MIKRNQRKKNIIFFSIVAIVFLIFIVIYAFKAYFFHKQAALKHNDNSITVLLLGTGGENHDGPNLTDTIMFANIDPKTKHVTFVSLPRDFWVNESQAKINTIYAFGQEKNPKQGLELAKHGVSAIVGQPINYAMRIDFEGFVKAIDAVGGIDVVVENTFDDYEYPIAGKEDDLCGLSADQASQAAQITPTGPPVEIFPCRYEHVHFDKGLVHMDGSKALTFVRSRHSLGPEGSDFSRSKRQEKIISSFKEKLFSLQTFVNPNRVKNLYDIIRASIDTDVKEEEFAGFISLAREMKDAKIQSVVLDIGDAEKNRLGLLAHPLISEEYGNQWVLAPRMGTSNYTEIQQYVRCLLTYKPCVIKPLK